MPVSADEYVASLPDFDAFSASIQSDLLALYLLTDGGAGSVTPGSIASLRSALHLAEHNRLAAHMSEQSKRKGGKKGRYVKLATGYALERGYANTLSATYLGRPGAKNVSAGLRATLGAIGDPAVKTYLEETVGAFEQGFLRSALVMAWCVSFGLVRGWLFRNHLAVFNAQTATWKAPLTISILDDFQDMTEGSVIATARKAGVVTKEQHKILKQLLDQRNSYAHPTTRAISSAIVEAYIDTVLRDIIPTFG